ncbi:MAG: type III pantothenate kinase [Chloroflexi bacterium]|nr:type III pantothenate kinase [Chloroflexota bacterium]
MLATFDISNTRIKAGIFEREELRATFSLAADVRRTADEYAVLLDGFLREEGVARRDVQGAAIASVVPPLTGAFEQVCTRLFKRQALVVGGPGTRAGIRIATQQPRELGADRIVNAIAVQQLYGSPAIVVDFDTATSFDVVAADGSYAGAIIAPGLSLAAEALFQHTSRLQRFEVTHPRTVIGKDTVSALLSGAVLGHVAMIEGMIARVRAELGQPAIVVATGELAALVAGETTVIDRIEPWLALVGLRLFYQRNEGHGDRSGSGDRPGLGGSGHPRS